MKLAVVIPAYRVKEKILGVIDKIGPLAVRIYVVDDACPEQSGDWVRKNVADPRVEVIFNEKNRGVGGAVIRGYRRAIEEGMDIAVKIDGDGQMDPADIQSLVLPLVIGQADYAKGNRFYRPRQLVGMPVVRLLGNAALSFMTKLSTGLYSITDPTNGFTAISCRVLEELDLDALSERYFFESDLLFRLATVGALVADVPMTVRYADEKSSMRIATIIPEFLYKHSIRFFKRILYQYFLRDFSVASIQLVFSIPLILFGLGYGGYHWWKSYETGLGAPTGTVVLSALSFGMGTQFLFGFLSFDMSERVRTPLHRRFGKKYSE